MPVKNFAIIAICIILLFALTSNPVFNAFISFLVIGQLPGTDTIMPWEVTSLQYVSTLIAVCALAYHLDVYPGSRTIQQERLRALRRIQVLERREARKAATRARRAALIAERRAMAAAQREETLAAQGQEVIA